MSEPTPLTLLSGFLGSGKTTMVNHLLTQPSGRRIAVVVNEFGELGIDGTLISGQTSGLIELRGGCICCANRGDLTRAIADLIDSGRPIDHIVVEASGLTDPGPAIETLVRPPLAERVAFSGTVSLLDAANFDRNLECAEAAYHQITYADLLVINKADLVVATTTDRIRSGLRRLNRSAPIITAVKSALPAETLLGDKGWQLDRMGPALDVALADHADDQQFTAISLSTTRPLDSAKLTDWLAQLSGAILRVKGIVQLNDLHGGAAVVQAVAGQVTISELPPRSRFTGGESALTLIGDSSVQPLTRAVLEGGFRACTL